MDDRTTTEISDLTLKLDVIGSDARCLVKLLIICLIPSILNGLHVVSSVYLAEEPIHWCFIDTLNVSWTNAQIREITSPKGPDESSCVKYNWNYTVFTNMSFAGAQKYVVTHKKPSTSSCLAYSYERNISSIAIDYDLVCDRLPLKSMIQMSLSLGKFIGAFLFGMVSDKFGRKVAFICGIVLYNISGPMVAIAVNYGMIIVGRLGLGMGTSAVFHPLFVVLSEISGSKHRGTITMIYAFNYPIGEVFCVMIAYFIRDWKTFQFAISAPAIVMIIFILFVPESPRWQITNGKIEEARKFINKEYDKIKRRNNEENKVDAAVDEGKSVKAEEKSGEMSNEDEKSANEEKSVNEDGKSVEEDGNEEKDVKSEVEVLQEGGNERPEEKPKGAFQNIKAFLLRVAQLLKYKELRHRLFLVLFTYFVLNMTYYVLALNVDNYLADRYLFGIITALVEMLSYLVPIPFLRLTGRRLTCLVLFYTGGILLLLLITIPRRRGELNIPISLTSSFSRLCLAGVFIVVLLETIELIPTAVRNSVVGFGSMSSHVGAMSAPFVVDLLGTVKWYIPSTLCGGLAIIAGTVMLLVPETKDKKIPETMEEVVNAPNEERVGFHQCCKPNSFCI